MTINAAEHAPGEAVPASGVYGTYFLGEYSGLKVLSVGDTFPPHAQGVAYRLHEAFA